MICSIGIAVVSEPLPVTLEKNEIPEVLRGGLQEEGGRWLAKFPGLLSSKGRLVLILPRVYAGAKTQELGNEPFLFVSALCRLMREARNSVASSELLLDQALLASEDAWQLLDRLEAALLLLRDFSEHGSICIHERHSSAQETGAIHWPRTLSRSRAIVSGVNVTIADPIRTRLRISQRHPLTLLHESICAEVYALLGRGGYSLPSGVSLMRDTIPLRDSLAILDRYERMLFRDRHQIIAGLLRRYLGSGGLGAVREAQRVSGILAVNFPMIWERMLAVALGPSREHQMPAGDYRLFDAQGINSRVAPGLYLKPDLVIDGLFNNREVIIVLDAKDYAPEITGDWPDTASIGKQLLYRYLMSDRYRTGQPAFERIGNAFLMPARIPQIMKPRRHHVRRASHEIRGEAGPAPFGRIVCLDVDFERVAQAYVNGRSDRELRSTIITEVMETMVTPG